MHNQPPQRPERSKEPKECRWCGEEVCTTDPEQCKEDQAEHEAHKKTPLEKCGLCWAVGALVPIDGRHDYFCREDKGGCNRVTRPHPRTDKERRAFQLWHNLEREEAKYIGGFDVDTRGRERVEIYDDAIYLVRRKEDEGRTMWPVLAMPFTLERIVLIEDEERLDVRTPAQICGTHGDVFKELKQKGRFLDPRQGERILALLAHEHRRTNSIETAQETFEVFQDQDFNRLNVKTTCYPQPGTQQEEFQQIQEILEYEPTKETWKAFRRFEEHYHPHEIAPAKATAALAPIARLLRSHRYIVGSPYLISTNSGAGKTTVAEAYSNTAWNQKERQPDDFNSEFRFAEYLSSSATPVAVNEAEKFDWKRFGANIKASLESENVTTRGTRELRMKKFPSRRIPIWTSNRLPSLAHPTLVRMKVVRFDEERRKLSQADQDAFTEVQEKLGPVGPCLARAWLKRFRTVTNLIEMIGERAREIKEAFPGSFEDLRRAKCWALDHIALEVWETASGGIHEAPPVYEFVAQVVAPVERDTFSFRTDRLSLFRAWFDRWRAEKRLPDGQIRGEDEDFSVHHWRPPDATIERHGWVVTLGLLQEYNKAAQSPEDRIDKLAELARLVAEAYDLPSDALMEGAGVPRWQIGGTRKRAAWVPSEDVEDWHGA